MDKLVKADVNELELMWKKGENGSAARFSLSNLMHTMSAAVCITTSNPNVFSISQPFSVIPPLSSSSYTIFFSDTFPITNNPYTITVRSSMLPIGKPHPNPDDLSSLFSKYRPNVFHDATIPISFIGPDVVQLLMHYNHVHVHGDVMKKALSACTKSQLTTFLTTAISSGKLDLVSSLLHATSDLIIDINLLSVAVRSGHLHVLKALLELETGIHSISETEDDSVFHMAAAMNRVDLFEVLLSSKIETKMVDSDGRTPIHVAAVHGHVEMIRFCVSNSKCGGNPEVKDLNGWTPLHCAASQGHLDASKCLLECCYNVKYVMTKDGKTAFTLAVENGHSHLFHLLHLGDILHRAARVDDVHGLKTCLAAGAMVNDTDQNGWTPLHRAAFKGRIQCVKLLLQYGAHVDVVNHHGSTPLHCALQTGHLEVALFLLAHGAK